MSSQHPSGNYPASKCIDGVTDSMANQTSDPAFSMCHTDPKDKTPKLTIELKGRFPVSSVVIFNRADTSWDRTSDLTVWVTDAPPKHNVANSGTLARTWVDANLLARYKGPGGQGEVITIAGDRPIWGKYVTIEQLHTTRPPINLLEVQVFEKVPPLGSYTTERIFISSVQIVVFVWALAT